MTEEKIHSNKHAEHKTKAKHSARGIKVKKSDMWKVISGILFVLLLISVFTGNGKQESGEELSVEEAKEKALSYINTNLMQPGTSAMVKNIEDIGNLYKIKLDISGREFDSYLTKDGSLLFPSVVDLNEEVEKPEQPEQPTQQPPAADLVKSDKPDVQLFVMSHCPFGTQAEKGMIPVAELLEDKIDFEIKFVNYAMHGEKETTEQLNQHCIKIEQGSKFLPYLKCFLKEGDGESCISEIGINKAKLESCAKKTDAEFKITENLQNPSGRYPAFLLYDEENKKYGVRGSPTLVVNDKVVSSARSPSAYLATICGAFNEAPEECSTQLSSQNPSSGFGFSASGGSGAGSCT